MKIMLALKLLPFFLSIYCSGQMHYDVKTPSKALNSLCRILIEGKQQKLDEIISEPLLSKIKSNDEIFSALHCNAHYWLKALENNNYTFAPKNYDAVVNISLRWKFGNHDGYDELIFVKDSANNWKFLGFPEE